MEDSSREEEDALFTYLMDVGAINIDGVSKDGELLYKIDPDKMKEYCPELLEVFNEDLEESLMDLFNKGLVDVQYNENLEAIFSVINEGINEIEKYGFYHMDDPKD
jgi:uncharacterized UBP type Zn finger protein